MTRRDRQLAAGLATAFLAGEWNELGLRGRAFASFSGVSPARFEPLLAAVLAAYRDPPHDRPRELAAFLQALDGWLYFAHPHVDIDADVYADADGDEHDDEGDDAESAEDEAADDPESAELVERLRVLRWEPTPTAMGRRRWPVTELPDLTALARLLDLDPGELAWFADIRGLERTVAEPLRHYRWRTLPKRHGPRLVAAPKPRLKEIQRRLLRHTVNPIPPHFAAHGCVPGASVRTAVTPHVGQAIVIRLDIEAFFASITAPRIWGVLRSAGVPEAVAHSITGLVTTVAPRSVWADYPVTQPGEDPAIRHRLGQRLALPHLPQGAPTSPGLANLVAFTLDRRLAGLAENFGANYTRYVDDLTFSGGPNLRAARGRFVGLVTEVLRDEGFRCNERKTVVLGSAGRQHVLGAVINDHPTLSRPERDGLRAILHNCVVHGWRTQIRDQTPEDFPAYLLGRISWAQSLDPVFGTRLRTAYDRIDWT